MNTNEELKTRLKTEFMRRFTYEAGDGFRMTPSPKTPEEVFNWIYTHVEPLQAENERSKKELEHYIRFTNEEIDKFREAYRKECVKNKNLQSENQKLREQLNRIKNLDIYGEGFYCAGEVDKIIYQPDKD